MGLSVTGYRIFGFLFVGPHVPRGGICLGFKK